MMLCPKMYQRWNVAPVPRTGGHGWVVKALVLLAAPWLGSASIAEAANPTANGVAAVLIGEDELRVTGSPDFDDHIRIYVYIIEPGQLFAGGGEVEPIPSDRTAILQITDETVPEDVFGLPVYQGDPEALEAALEAMLKPEDLDRIIVRTFSGDDIIDCRGLVGEGAVTLQTDGDEPGVDGGPGNDIIYGGAEADTLHGGDGDDIIFGGAGDDVITGGPGDDILNGGVGADTINGQEGNDLIRGGDGADSLSGGGGWDVADYITDGGPGSVSVSLNSNSATDGWGNADSLADDSFVAIRGKGTNDTLEGDPQGGTTILGGGGNDSITTYGGGRGGNVVFGDAGNDTINTGNQADTIFGGPGDDDITAGDGADTICGDGEPSPNWAFNPPDSPQADSTRPVDPVGPVPMASRLPPRVPVPGLPGGDPRFAYAGNDKIRGGDGSDIIYGGLGSDRINGDAGSDLIYGDFDYDLYALIQGVLVWGFGDGVNDQATSVGGSDMIRGGAGSDIIYPGAGSDTVSGGDDADRIYSGFGSDLIIGGEVFLDSDNDFGTSSPETDRSPADWVDYSLVPAGTVVNNFPLEMPDGSIVLASVTLHGGGIRVDLGSLAADIGRAYDGERSSASLTSGSFDTLRGIENVNGSPNNDFIMGSDIVNPISTRAFNRGYDNLIFGRGGDDIIVGGRGDDLLSGDGEDVFGFFFSGTSSVIPGNDIIWGDAGNQFEGGNDVILGGGGNDELHGEGGDDVIAGGAGNDRIEGGQGLDTLDYSGQYENYWFTIITFDDLAFAVPRSTSGLGVPLAVPAQQPELITGINADLSAYPGIVEDEFGDTDVIINCSDGTVPDWSTGTLLPSVGFIDCSVAENKYVARFEIVFGTMLFDPDSTNPAFNDVIKGYDDPAYPDVATEIWGLAGNDHLIGGIGNDTLYGGSEDDVLEGLGGNDFMDGGTHTLLGARDTLSYAQATGDVTATLALTSQQNTGAAGVDTIVNFENITGGAGNDRLTGDGRRNILRGGPGDDLLHGRGDEDPIVNGIVRVEEDLIDGGPGVNTADYRLGDPRLVRIAPGLTAAINDGEGGSDVLDNIHHVLLPTSTNLRVDAGPDKNVRPGGSVVLEGSATGGLGSAAAPTYQFIWNTEPATSPAPGQDPDDCALAIPGLNDRCIAQPIASPATTTTYRLKVKVIDSALGAVPIESTDFVKVTVATPLVVSAGSDRTINLGQGTPLNGSASGGVTPYVIAWTPVQGLSRTDILLPQASPNETTTYTLTVTDQVGQVASDEVTVTITSSFAVNAGADRTINPGQSTSLNGTVSGGVAPYVIAWTPAQGLSHTDILTPQASPSQTTTYTLTVSDQVGRVVVDQVTVTVASPFTVNAGADVTIQAGQSIQLNAAVSGGIAPYSYQWTPAAGLSSTTIATPIASPAATTSYTVTVTEATNRTAFDFVVVTVVPVVPDPGDDPSPVIPACGAGAGWAAITLNALFLGLICRRRRV